MFSYLSFSIHYLYNLLILSFSIYSDNKKISDSKSNILKDEIHRKLVQSGEKDKLDMIHDTILISI